MKPIANPGASSTKRKANELALRLIPDIDAALESGAGGLAEIADWLNTHGIPAQRGGLWRPETVRRLLRRIAALGHSSLDSRSASDWQRARAPTTRVADFKARIARRKAERVALAN